MSSASLISFNWHEFHVKSDDNFFSGDPEFSLGGAPTPYFNVLKFKITENPMILKKIGPGGDAPWIRHCINVGDKLNLWQNAYYVFYCI